MCGAYPPGVNDADPGMPWNRAAPPCDCDTCEVYQPCPRCWRSGFCVVCGDYVVGDTSDECESYVRASASEISRRERNKL